MSKEVIVTVKADTKDAQKNVNDLNKDLKKTETDLSGIENMADKATGGLISGFKGSIGAIKGVVKGFKTLRGAIIATGIGALVVVVSSLMAAFTDSEEGANKFSKILGVLGTVTGNVLDKFADLGEAIISAFENPKKTLKSFRDSIQNFVIDKVNKVLDGVGLLGSALKKVFSGDFSGALEDAKNGFVSLNKGINPVKIATDALVDGTKKLVNVTKDFIEEQEREIKLSKKVSDDRAKAAKLERELLVERSILESKIADLRLKSRQEEEFTAAQRKQFLLDAQKLEEGLLKKETEVLELRRDAQELENTFSRSDIKALDKLAEAEAAVNRQSAIRLNQQRATQRELNTLNKQIAADNKRIANEKKAQDDAEAKRKQEEIDAAKKKQEEIDKKAADDLKKFLEIKKGLENEYTNSLLSNQIQEQNAVKAKYDNLIEQAKLYGEDTKKLEEARQSELKSINDKFAEQNRQARIKEANDRLETASQVTQAVQSLGDAVFAHRMKNLKDGTKEQLKAAKQQFNFNKALQLGMAVIDTGKAITASLAQSPIAIGPVPNPAGIASLAFASISGAAQIAMIAAQKYEAPKKSASSTGSPSIGGGGASATQAPNFNVVGQSGFNQVAGALGQQAPVQAFVVAGDVTTAQQLQNNTIQQATF